MPFHGPVTYRQSEAVDVHCRLHYPPYCWAIYWIPGHPFHRMHGCRCKRWCECRCKYLELSPVSEIQVRTDSA